MYFIQTVLATIVGSLIAYFIGNRVSEEITIRRRNKFYEWTRKHISEDKLKCPICGNPTTKTFTSYSIGFKCRSCQNEASISYEEAKNLK